MAQLEQTAKYRSPIKEGSYQHQNYFVFFLADSIKIAALNMHFVPSAQIAP